MKRADFALDVPLVRGLANVRISHQFGAVVSRASISALSIFYDLERHGDIQLSPERAPTIKRSDKTVCFAATPYVTQHRLFEQAPLKACPSTIGIGGAS